LLTHFQGDSDDDEKAAPVKGGGNTSCIEAAKFPSRPHVRYLPTPEMAHLLLIKACTMQHTDMDTTLFEGSGTKKK